MISKCDLFKYSCHFLTGDLVHAIHSLCRGQIDERVKGTLAAMSDSQGVAVEGTTRLYARNLDVDYANYQGLRMQEGEFSNQLKAQLRYIIQKCGGTNKTTNIHVSSQNHHSSVVSRCLIHGF